MKALLPLNSPSPPAPSLPSSSVVSLKKESEREERRTVQNQKMLKGKVLFGRCARVIFSVTSTSSNSLSSHLKKS